MNAYMRILEDDVDKVQELSRVCRGEWCRFLESEVDCLHNELIEFRILEGDFETARIDELAAKLRDAYRHLAPDFHV